MMKTSERKVISVALIGAGPIGLEMAVALRDAGVDYVHIEAQQVGQTISWFPRQARFFSSPERIAICGVPLMTNDQSKATREDYLSYLLSIVQQFGLEVQTYERVLSVTAQPIDGSPGYVLETQRSDGVHQYSARRVIFAIGDMHAARPLVHEGMGAVTGADLPHVSSYFDEPHPYAGQRLLIVGGKNSAAEAAIRCYRAGADVTLCHRKPELSDSIKYWLKPEIEWLIKSGEIKQYAGYAPVAITPTHVDLAPVDSSGAPRMDIANAHHIESDFVLLLIGYIMDPTLLRELGVELYGPGLAPRVDPETMETNLPGVYVAGTAVAGTQLSFKLFIENCHAHVVRILRHITQQDPQHINSLAYARLHENPLPAES